MATTDTPPDGRGGGGPLRLLITNLWRGTKAGSWTPVLQFAFLVVLVGGTICFVWVVISGGPVGLAVKLAGSCAAACILGAALSWLTRSVGAKRRSKQELQAAVRAAKRRSLPPVEPPAPLTGDAAQKSDDQDRDDKA